VSGFSKPLVVRLDRGPPDGGPVVPGGPQGGGGRPAGWPRRL